MKLYITIFLSLTLILTGCKSKTKITGNYIDVSGDITQVHLDKSLTHIPVTVPRAKPNTVWRSSNSSLTGIPENILVKSELDHVKSYNINSSNKPDVNRTPLVSNNLLYVLDSRSTVYAYDILNLPTVVWKKHLDPLESSFLGGGLTVDGKYLAITYGNKELVLLNAKTGDEIWRHNLSNISRIAPTIYKHHVLALTVDNKLYCIGLESGALNWIHEEAGEEFGMIGAASPEGSDNTIVAPYLSGQFVGIDLATGQIKWSVPLQTETQSFLNDISVTPVISNGIAYTSNYGGSLSAVDVDSGKVEWSHRNAGGNNAIWIASDYLYSINKNNQLLALYKDTGAVKWIYNFALKDGDDPVKFSGPIMINSKLYVATSAGQLIVISPITGKKIKEIQIPKDSYSTPIAVGNHVYLLANSGTLLVL